MTRPGLNIYQHGLGLDVEQNNLRADHKSRKQTERGGQPMESVCHWVVLNVLKVSQPLGQWHSTFCSLKTFFFVCLKKNSTFYCPGILKKWCVTFAKCLTWKPKAVALFCGWTGSWSTRTEKCKTKLGFFSCSSVAQPQGVKDSRLCLHNVHWVTAFLTASQFYLW